MCLIKETGDRAPISLRAGGAGGCQPSLPQNFGQLKSFGQQEKFWQSQFLQKFPCFVSSFFFFERYFFVGVVKSAKFISGLWVLRAILSNTYNLCRYLQGRRSMSSAIKEMPTWPNIPYASTVLTELELRFSKNNLCFGKHLSQWNT